MAKSKSNSKEQQDELDFLQKQRQEYEYAIKVIREFNKASQQKRGEMEKDLVSARKIRETFEQQYKSLKDINVLIEKTSKGFSIMTDELTDQQKRVQDLGKDWSEIDDLQNSITSHYGKQYGDIGLIQKKIDGTKSIITSISSLLDKNSDVYDDQLEKILDAAEAYKSFPATFATLNKQVKQRKITEEQMVQQMRDNLDDFDEMVSKIRIINDETGDIVELFKTLNSEQDTFNKASERRKEARQTAGAIVTESPFAASPVIGSAIAKSTESLLSPDKIAGATLVGLGYILLKTVGQLAAIDDSLTSTDKQIRETFKGKERQYEAFEKQLDLETQSQEKLLELTNGYTARFAKFDFATQLGQMVIDFNKVSKTAFFGSGLGSVKYAKDQLELAGVGADVIVSTMTDMSTGANSGMKGLATDVAVFSKKTGIASGEVSGLTGLFRMLDKTGGADAFSNLEKSLSGVGLNGFNVADIAGELKDASSLALEYNIRNSAQLVKQVKNVRDMGASWVKIASAGKSMVLNYKDSIRKEMELSAMLGENVDLSEARALFAAGRNDEAFGVLKSSGILQKAQEQGLFAVQALQSSLGGMDLEQLAARRYEQGPKQAVTSNQQYLSTLKSATETQRVESAEFDIERAIIRLTRQDLEQGLLYDLGQSANITRLELAKLGVGINKFIDVELQQMVDSFKNPFGAAGSMGKLFLRMDDPLSVDKARERVRNGTPADLYGRPNTGFSPYYPNKSGTASGPAGKSTFATGGQQLQGNVQPTLNAQTNFLESADTSLKMLNVQSNIQTQLLQNIQALTVVTSRLGTIGMGSMKLLLDGKEVKSRIEKITIQEKGKTKN